MRRVSRTTLGLLGVALSSVLASACASSQSSTASSPPPKDAAKVGVPFVLYEGKAKASVTLTGVTYSTTLDQTGAIPGYAILHLKITGESPQPFSVVQEDFSYQGTQEPDPYQPEDTNSTGVDPVAWSETPQRLPNSSIREGQVVTGNVPLAASTGTLMLITMDVSDRPDDLPTDSAQWLYNLP
jgi:hypothetical protein